MNLSEKNYRQYDLDWFFIVGNKLCHAASAGGNLPHSIINLLEKYSTVLMKIADLPSSYKVEVNPHIHQQLNGQNNVLGMKMYLNTFEGMASKGCYSFDRLNLSDSNDDTYILVANPEINDNNHSEYNKLVDSLRELIPTMDDFHFDMAPFNLIALCENAFKQ